MTSDPATLCIRPATAQDAGLVHTLVLEIAAHQDSVADVAATPDDWATMLARPDVVVLLAFAGDQPLGYASTIRRLHPWSGGDVIALDDLWVRPEARDRGVGAALMDAVAGLAAPEGLTVTWGALETNEGAHRFYLRLGAAMRTKAVFAWRPTTDPPSGRGPGGVR